MKSVCYILFILLTGSPGWCQQFYLRGEVKDESGNVLQNVKITHLRSGYIYKSGSVGSFGITVNQRIDTFNFSHDGYIPEKIVANAENYLSVQLKLAPANRSTARLNKLLSFTRGMAKEDQKKWFAGDETYASIVENKFVNAGRFPATGISLNIDRASYSNIRRFLASNSIVPPDAVRIEEMLNYFNLNYTKPQGNDPFAIRTQLTSCPWNPTNQLFYIDLSAKKINLETLPPSNLVFLIDVSGSMDMTNRLPLLKSAFRLLVNNLRPKDSVAIVVYGGITGIMLNTTSGAEKEKILTAIDELTPGGSTPGASGINLAYTIARRHFIVGGNNRVILATDGDFNVGLKTEEELDELISRNKESGIYLTCLGVGMGNYKDSKIQTLARKGNGNFSYLDNFGEAQKVLMKEFTQTLYAVADDAFMNVEFNPKYVKEYRLLGFDNKVGALNDTLAIIEGGEIGSGYSMTGIFEIEPETVDSNTTAENFAKIKLHYKSYNDTTNRVFKYQSPLNFTAFSAIDKSHQFSTAVAMFGSLLRVSSFTKNVDWDDIT
ncbi:MAG TPA: von Willebrand factor type A domain-containing protein, partial [Chitinophagaceae bacterium]|nr:von Willebrand factor type A domain-containing protein [Chitinophagaceae bacterium]